MWFPRQLHDLFCFELRLKWIPGDSWPVAELRARLILVYICLFLTSPIKSLLLLPDIYFSETTFDVWDFHASVILLPSSESKSNQKETVEKCREVRGSTFRHLPRWSIRLTVALPRFASRSCSTAEEVRALVKVINFQTSSQKRPIK